MAIRPNAAAVYDGLGTALRSIGREGDAIEQFQRAIQIDPNFAGAYASLGGVLKSQGKVSESIEQYRHAVQIDPKYSWGHYVLANALRAGGQLDEAIAHYHQALDINPKMLQIHDDLATALRSAGRIGEALDEYQLAVQFKPKSAKPHYNMGESLVELGRLDEAIEQFRYAIQNQPNYVRAYESLGRSLIAKRQFADARLATSRALELLSDVDPHREQLHAQLDRCDQLASMDARIPAILQDRGTVLDPAERLLCAELLFNRQEYDEAACQYTDVLADSSNTIPNLYLQYGFAAARAAARAGCSDASDESTPSDPRQILRCNQARSWLQLSLANLTEKENRNLDDDRLVILRTLSQWLNCPDLSSIRDERSLLKLPTDDDQQCRKLWLDVNAEFRRTKA